MKDQLIFDTTNANTILDSDSVGAFLRSSDGTLITHSTVGGKQALDVSVADGINVEVDLSHLDDSVRLGDGTNFFTSTSENGDISLDVHISNSNIEVTQGTDPWIIGDGGGSITIDAVDLDIRDLVAATDSIASHTHDGSGNAITSTAGALDVYITGSDPVTVNDAALANTAIKNDALSIAVASTRESLVGTALADRKYLYAYNADNRKMYIGDSAVTVADGFPISPGSYVELRAGAAVDVQVISEKVGHDIRTLELS